MPLKHLEAAVKALAAETLTPGATTALANISRAIVLLKDDDAKPGEKSAEPTKRGRSKKAAGPKAKRKGRPSKKDKTEKDEQEA